MSEIQKHTKPNVPNLRFPGFCGEWERKQVRDIAPLQRGFDLPSQSLKEGIYPVVYSNGIMNYHSEYKCEAPGLVTGRSGTIGKLTYIESGRYWPHNTTLWVTDFKNNESKFVYYFYEHLDLSRFSSGSGVPTLNRNDVHTYKTFIPSLTEQKKIASFLSLLDERISIQSKVIELYESLIKALAYEKIGKHTTNITLSECVRCSSSTIKESDLLDGGTVPAYGASGISGYMNNAISENDSILITKDGSGVGSLRYVRGSHSFVGTLNSMTPNEGVYLPYIYYALQNVCFESYRTGQAIPHIYFKDYGKEAIYCPSFDEQKRLAKGLEIIDSKVGIERAALQYLHSAKAYLLSAMFI